MNNRYKRGLSKLNEIDGEAGQEIINNLQDICPDLAKYTIEFPFGDIYSRPLLDVKMREVATIAALTVLGTIPQLEVHIKAGLNVGITEEEIKEIIIQMAVYGGFPCALNAMIAMKNILIKLSDKNTKKEV